MEVCGNQKFVNDNGLSSYTAEYHESRLASKHMAGSRT